MIGSMNRLLPALGAPTAPTLLAALTLLAAAVVETAADLSAYERVSGISGNLSSTGSDTLANLITLWTEAFKRHYPNVNIQVQAPGSSTAPTALTEGTSNLGPMSRLMKDREIEAFETRRGYKPTAIRVAVDALAVYVHKDNPIQSMSLPEVDAVFFRVSPLRRRGEYPHMGRCRSDRRVGDAADATLRTQLRVRHLWLFQAKGTLFRRFQEHCQRAAGLRVRGSGRHFVAERHWLLDASARE